MSLELVGKAIQALRKAKGYETLEMFSAATGISVSTLSRIERGEQRATPDRLLAMAEVAGVTVEDVASRAGLTEAGLWRLLAERNRPAEATG